MSDVLKYVVIGFICMTVMYLIRNKCYPFKVGTTILWMLIFTATGVAGTGLMFFIETGRWGGTSFFGAVFLVPLAAYIIAKIANVSCGRLMDFCAVETCIMLVVMKVRCVIGGCCAGKKIILASGEIYRFPSQMIEAVVMIIILIALLFLDRNVYCQHKIYPMLLIMYGSTRFLLNFFRTDLAPFVWKIPPGHLWSIVVVVVGVFFMIRLGRHNITKTIE